MRYLVPLPMDGAVAGYAFHVGGRRIVGEIDRIQVARERFETRRLLADCLRRRGIDLAVELS